MVKKDWIFYLISAAFVIVVVLVDINRSNELHRLKSTLSEKDSKISYYQSESQRLVAQKNAAEVEARDIKKLYPEIYKSLKKDLDINARDLKAYIKSEIKASGSGNGTISNHYYTTPAGESKEYATFSVDDGYLAIKADILDSLHAPYSYSYSDTIQQAISLKRKWFLGNEKLYGSATLSNPNAKVVGSTNILIKDYRDKRFGLGVGVMYDPFSKQFRLGVGVQYNIIKF